MRSNNYTRPFAKFLCVLAILSLLSSCNEQYGNATFYQNKADFAQKIVNAFQSLLVGYEKHGLLTEQRRQVINQQITDWGNYQNKMIAQVANTKRPVIDSLPMPTFSPIPPLSGAEKIRDMSTVFVAQCHINRDDEKVDKYLAINFDHDDTHSPFLSDISSKMTNEIDSQVCQLVSGQLFVSYQHGEKMHTITMSPNFSLNRDCGVTLDSFSRTETKQFSDSLLTPVVFNFDHVLPEKDKMKGKMSLTAVYFMAPSPYFLTEDVVVKPKPKLKKRK